MKHMLPYLYILLSSLIFLGMFPVQEFSPQAFAQTSVVLSAELDNTLYENPNGNTSNGKGEFLFIGRNNQSANSIRRALIQFDLTSLQGLDQPDSVALSLSISRTSDMLAAPLSLHLVEKEWGEGNSDAPGSESEGDSAQTDDATWIYAKFDTAAWENPGGDFVASPSALDTLDGNSSNILFSSSEMLTDVLNALQKGDSSISWIIMGDESRNQSARKINSRESSMEELRPSLFVHIPAATSIHEERKRELRVFPNPLSADQLFIESNELIGKEVSYILVNMSGKIMYQGGTHLFSGKERIRLEDTDLPNGLYILSVHLGLGNHIQKLIIKSN